MRRDGLAGRVERPPQRHRDTETQRTEETMLFRGQAQTSRDRISSLCLGDDMSGLCKLKELAGIQRSTAEKSRANDGRMTGKSRASDGVLTGLGRAAGRSNDAPLEATSLVTLFRLYARGLQTLCRNRSIMRQNVAEVDCLPYRCVSHKVMALWHLPQSDRLDTKGNGRPALKNALAGGGKTGRSRCSS